MTTTVKPRRTFTPGKVPTISDLADGEVGINVPDGKIYVRQGSEIVLVGGKGTGAVEDITTESRIPGISLFTDSAYPQSNPKIVLQANFVPNNRVLAAPTLLSGPATFRELVALDIPSLSASKITEGTFQYARLPYPQDFIEGLTISTGDTSITVSSGSAYVPSVGTVVASTGATISSSRASNTSYHLYMTPTGSISRLSTAPVSYHKTARIAGSQTNMRYIGSVRTDASGKYIHQISYPGQNCVEVLFLNNTTTNVIHNGTAPSTPVDVSAAAYAPITTNRLKCRVQSNIAAAGLDRIYAWNGSSFVIWTNVAFTLIQFTLDIPCDSTPKIQLDSTDPNRSPFVMLYGYYYDR